MLYTMSPWKRRSRVADLDGEVMVSMPRIRYQVAVSLDGYIAGPRGEADWIIMDPDIDFDALSAQFDTFIMGRRTFDAMGATGSGPAKTFVFSRTLRPDQYPNVSIISEVSAETIAPIRAQASKDIWLFGGGAIFRSLLEAGFVDTVEVAVMPVLLGGGVSLLPHPAQQTKLVLTGHRVHKTGVVSLEYSVKKPSSKRR
jgi:dihydrofolate reductase